MGDVNSKQQHSHGYSSSNGGSRRGGGGGVGGGAAAANTAAGSGSTSPRDGATTTTSSSAAAAAAAKKKKHRGLKKRPHHRLRLRGTDGGPGYHADSAAATGAGASSEPRSHPGLNVASMSDPSMLTTGTAASGNGATSPGRHHHHHHHHHQGDKQLRESQSMPGSVVSGVTASSGPASPSSVASTSSASAVSRLALTISGAKSKHTLSSSAVREPDALSSGDTPDLQLRREQILNLSRHINVRPRISSVCCLLVV